MHDVAKAKETSTPAVVTKAVLTNPAQNAARPVGPGGQPAPTGPRRGSTMKEVIPFEWKLIGEAAGAVLTLFKSVEREDVDAQFERISRETYYTNLRIVDIDFKIKQSVAIKTELKKVKLAQEERAAKLAKRLKTAETPKVNKKKLKAKKIAPKKVAKVKKVSKAKKVTKKKVTKSAASKKKKSVRAVKSKSTKSKKAARKKTVTKSAAKRKKKKAVRRK